MEIVADNFTHLCYITSKHYVLQHIEKWLDQIRKRIGMLPLQFCAIQKTAFINVYYKSGEHIKGNKIPFQITTTHTKNFNKFTTTKVLATNYGRCYVMHLDTK